MTRVVFPTVGASRLQNFSDVVVVRDPPQQELQRKRRQSGVLDMSRSVEMRLFQQNLDDESEISQSKIDKFNEEDNSD